MVRSLTAPTIAEKNSIRTAPINIIKIEFGGAIGTKYYSDHNLGTGDGSSALNAAQRIVNWGTLSFSSPRGAAFNTADTTSALAFRDNDKVIYGYFKDTALQNKLTVVYQHFSGLNPADVQAIIEGVISDPPVWARGVMRVNLADMSYRYRTELGTIVTTDDIADVDPESRGQIVPLVFGEVERTRCLGCQDALVTNLIRKLWAPGSLVDQPTKFFVENAENFPQNTLITVRVGTELMDGTFSGNTFNITKRDQGGFGGTRWVILSSIVSANQAGVDDYEFLDWGLNPNTDDFYQGFWIEATVGAQMWFCEIEASSASHTSLHWKRLGADPLANIVPGTSYRILNKAVDHEEGSLVFMASSYKYIVSDAPCADVKFLESNGSRQEPLIEVVQGIWPGTEAHVTSTETIEGWFQIPPGLYTVDKNDISIYGASHPVTTVTFPRILRSFHPGLEGIYATVDGVESEGDGTGTVYTDPVDIIDVILQRFAGVPAGYIDSASFAQASTDGTSFIPFGFVLSSIRDTIELNANLAFQARCMMLWEGGKAKLLWLKDSMAASSLTISKNEIVQTTLSISRTAFDSIVSEVEGMFYPKGQHNRDGEKRSLIATDAVVEAAYGRRVQSIDLWAHTDIHQAGMITSFWLTRWKWIWEQIEFTTFLTSLELERQDVVELNWNAFFLSGQLGRVLDITHGFGSKDNIDAIKLKLELPIGPGCATTCEVSCETTVETGCLVSCESVEETCWQCETSCEEACELWCTTRAQTMCVFFDAGCDETSCSCEVTCETGCKTEGCDNVGCMTSCQLPEEIESCQKEGAETRCNGSWQTGCLGYCETSGCEGGCEAACEAGDCQTGGCEVAGCEQFCQTGGCQTGGCETSCETGGCETSCETGQEWTPGSNVCNSCDPALPDDIYITPASVAPSGGYTWCEGIKTKVSWYTGCKWKNGNSYMTLEWNTFGGGSWDISIAADDGGGPQKIETTDGVADSCDPFTTPQGTAVYHNGGYNCSGDSCMSVVVSWS